MDKFNIQHEAVQQFRPGILTSEFLRCVISLVLIWATQFYTVPSISWAIALTGICVAYAIGRGIFKKSRLSLVGKGERTSEFWMTTLVQIALAVRWYQDGIDPKIALICIAICEAGYQISRGIGKSFIPRDVKLPFGLGG